MGQIGKSRAYSQYASSTSMSAMSAMHDAADHARSIARSKRPTFELPGLEGTTE
jgi:hypothetical protein